MHNLQKTKNGVSNCSAAARLCSLVFDRQMEKYGEL